MNEFKEKDLDLLAFPHLFPYGRGGILDKIEFLENHKGKLNYSILDLLNIVLKRA